LLEWLNSKYNLKLDIFVIGDKMVEVINSYKCHFNKNIANDINYRSFETIGCGTILLTNYNHQYSELGFKNGVNCFFYTNFLDLTEKIDYIKNTDLNFMTEKILQLATKHTYKNRINYLMEKLYA
jgi:spore maturation protein CgeB